MSTDKIRSRVIQNKIDSVFEINKLEDLKKFMNKRHYLNLYNSWLPYIFHIVQSGGILTSSYGVSVDNKSYFWIGVCLNMLASLIQVFEKLNKSQLKTLLDDIQAIKEDRYVDESPFVDLENFLTDDDTDINLMNMERSNYINNYINNIKRGNNNNFIYSNDNDNSNSANIIINNIDNYSSSDNNNIPNINN